MNTSGKIYALCATLFKAVPNASLFNSLNTLATQQGEQAVLNLVQSSGAMNSAFSSSLSNTEFANLATARVLNLSDTYNFDTSSTPLFTQVRNAVSTASSSMDRTSVLSTLLNALDSVSLPELTSAKAHLSNVIQVGEYYVSKGGAAQDLSTLQSLISGVTADSSSITTARSAVDSALLAASTGTGTGTSTGTTTPGTGTSTDAATNAAGIFGSAEAIAAAQTFLSTGNYQPWLEQLVSGFSAAGAPVSSSMLSTVFSMFGTQIRTLANTVMTMAQGGSTQESIVQYIGSFYQSLLGSSLSGLGVNLSGLGLGRPQEDDFHAMTTPADVDAGIVLSGLSDVSHTDGWVA